ncbi:MAG: hypothetical protein M3R01_05960 [Actinomycetota bacterium]|nr:hypothetical protein [Actinomycetota bacterium]
MKGKWAQGIVPRHFAWVIKDQLAVCERLGGYGPSHRRVRRQEEIIWAREQGFSRIVSLLPSPHNLHAYDELGMAWQHVPFGPHDDAKAVLGGLYPDLRRQLAAGDRLLLHQEELGDSLQGAMTGYLIYAGLVAEGPRAIAIVEHLVHRPLGPAGRELVGVAQRLTPAAE